jgi:hypothetical protein
VNRTIEVLLDVQASPTELAAISAAFDAAGIAVDDLSAGYSQKSLDIPWVVLISLGGGLTAGAFLRSFFSEAGKEAGLAVKTWHEQMREARAASRLRAGNVAIKDQEGTWIIFSVMPDEAYAKLLELDWETERGGYFVWDQDQSEWRNASP